MQGTVASGLSKPKKIAQTRAIEIRLKKNIQRTLQLDGEPWVQEGPFTIKISIFDQALMLLNTGEIRHYKCNAFQETNKKLL